MPSIPRHQILGTAACAAAFGSAAIHGGYFCAIHRLPIYDSGECIHFSFFLSHWVAISAALMLAGLGGAFLAASLFAKPRVLIGWRNLATLLFLVPAAYTGTCIVKLFL